METKFKNADFQIRTDKDQNKIVVFCNLNIDVEKHAKLIASATDMLQALINAENELCKFYIHVDRPNKDAEILTQKVWDQVKCAIQKATE